MAFLEKLPYERLTANLAVLTLLGVVLLATVVLAPAAFFEKPEVRQDLGETLRGTVRRVLSESRQPGPRGEELRQRLELQLEGDTVTIDRVQVEQDARRFDLNAGDKVLVNRSEGFQGEQVYTVVDYDRDSSLWLFALAFAAFVIAVGRWQGLTSLIGMVASLLVILRFIVPGIVSGYDPVVISILGAMVIMVSSLYLSHGVNRKTTTALVGTAISLAITAGLAILAVETARLSGLADEQSATLNIVTSGGINPEGLLLAGIIIGALGVLDDVTVAQASAIQELKAANPLFGARELFSRGMNVGRDHIASTVNTLFLAYAGAALPLLILFSLQTEPARILVSREFLATEVFRTLVGSIGIVASVPLTTALAAWSINVIPQSE
jgi:uncharacterized membrane protein